MRKELSFPMNWIETQYRFPEIDPTTKSYLEDVDVTCSPLYRYSFDTLPRFRSLMSNRLEGRLSSREMLEAAKETFRNKPREESEWVVDEGRCVVDYIYEL